MFDKISRLLYSDYNYIRKQHKENLNALAIQNKTKVSSVQLGKTLSFVKFVVE